MTSMGAYALELAETALRRITDVRLNDHEPIEIRINPADYDELITYSGQTRSPQLWDLPLKADAKVLPGQPRILVKAGA